MALMPPAIPPGAGSGMDPTTLALINAGSSVLGKALSPGTAGPSQASTGGWYDFGDSPFVVDFGAGSASSMPAGLSPWIGIGVAALIGAIAWKLWKKQ